MPRGGSRSNSGSRPSPSSAKPSGGFFSRGPARPQAPAARPAPAAPAAPVQSGGGMMSGIAGTVVQGMAFGAGSEVGHQAVRSLMGGSSGHAPAQQQEAPAQQTQQYAQPQEHPCQGPNTNFMTCLRSNNGDIGICQQYMDILQQCERDMGGRNMYQ